MMQTLKEELEQMIKSNRPYEEILKKSQELDKHISEEFKKMNKNNAYKK